MLSINIEQNKRIFRMVFLAAILLILAACAGIENEDAKLMFQNSKKPIELTIYPVNIVIGERMEHDRELARLASGMLSEAGLANPVIGSINHTHSFQWGHNQAKMLQSSARAFARQVKADNIQTDYALLIEMLCSPKEYNMIGVHYYLVDKQGRIASISLSNSHWDEFKSVNPHNRKEGMQVANNMLKRDFK